MEPFTIHCETCAARLKVRRAALVNQVLACPKCNNMVRVVAPEGWDLEEDTIPSMPPHPGRGSDSRGESGDPSQGDFSNFDDIDDLIAGGQTAPSQPPIPKPPQKPRKATPAAAKKPAAQPPEDGPLLPDQSWTSAGTKKKQRLILLAGAGFAVVAMIVAAIAIFVANSNKPVAEKDDTPTVTDKAETPIEANPQEEKSPESQDKPDEPGPTAQVPDDLESTKDSTTTEPANQTDSSTSPETKETDSDSDPLAELSLDPPNNNMENETPLVAKPETQEHDLDDPLGNLDGASNDNTDPLLGGDFDDATKISSQLGELNALLQESGLSLSSIQNLANANRRSNVGLPKYFVERPEQTQTNLAQALSNKLSGIQYDQIPLTAFLREMSPLVGAPFSLHVESMKAAEIDWNGSVSMMVKDEDLATSIDQCLAPLKLSMEVIDTGQVVILADGWSDLVERSYQPHRLSDTTPAGHANFVRRIRRMFSKDAWTDQTVIEMRGDQLFVKQVPQVHYQIDRLLTKLSAAQDLNESASNEDAAKVLETEWNSSETVRKSPTRFQPTLDAPLSEFVRNLEQKSNCTILVDWNSLSNEGWLPETLITGEFSEANLQDSLHQLSRALGCTYRAIDATTFEILTHREADARPELQVYAAKQIVQGAVKSDALMETLGRTFHRESNLVQVGYDEDSQSVVVIAPQDVQVLIEAVMKRLRKGS